MNITLIGSSIFEQWASASKAFPGCSVRNLAVGGTCTDYWIDAIAAVLNSGESDVIAYYCGSNDFNSQVPPERIIENTLRIGNCVVGAGKTYIYYDIIKAPQKRGMYSGIDHVNAQIAARLPEACRYVDLNGVLCPDSADVDGLYVEDELHLTDMAYALMAAENITQLGLS